MNYYLIFFGMLLLNIPSFGLFDFIPDFVGALILIYALRDVDILTDKASKATKSLWFTSALSLIKNAIYYLYIISYGADNGNVRLLFSFLFFVSETILLLLSFSAVYSTLDFLKMRYGTSKELSQKGADTAKTLSYIRLYTVLRCFLAVLPDFLYLTTDISTANISTLITMLRIAVCVLSFALLIPAVIKLFANARYLNLDEELKENLSEKAELLKNTETKTYAKSKLKSVYFVFMICVAASCRLCIDERDIIPKIIPAVLFVLVFTLIPGRRKIRIWGCILSALLAILSIAYLIFSSAYYADFTAESSLWFDVAATLYGKVAISQSVQYIPIFCVMLLFSFLVKDFSLKYFELDTSDEKEAKISFVKKSAAVFRVSAAIFCSVSALSPFLVPTFGIFDMISALGGVFLLAVAYFTEPRFN